MANTTVGFRDLRSPAELLLAPRVPASRSLVNTNTLKLNIGGTSAPGVITDVSQITGAIRNSVGNALTVKGDIAKLISTLTAVLSKFDANKTSFLNGTLLPSSPLNNPVVGVPTAEQFFQFSGLNPGQQPPAQFSKLIEQRKSQLQKLISGFSGVLTNPKLSGVLLQENTAPTAYPRDTDIPTVPRLAQGGAAAFADSILKDKLRFVVKGVTIGSGKPNFWSRLLNAAAVLATPGLNPVTNHVFKDRKSSGAWSEPASPYAAQWPYNKVQQTESGHVMELDDTPGAERVHIFHRSGSFIEMHPDGTVVYKSMKDGYAITMADQYVNVKGKCHVAVDGETTLYVKGDVHIQSDGDINVQTKKDFNVYADNINLRAKKTAKLDGKLVDLRYTKLPSMIPVFAPGVAPVLVGFAPRIDITALAMDFPSVSFSNPNANLVADAVEVPPSVPLSNPAIYTQKTPEAVSYRGRLFDTPEEVGDFELYAGHLDLMKTLSDFDGDPKQLAGKLTPQTITVVSTLPNITYLNFDDYKGKYTYANDYVLANTSFKLSDLVDIAIHPDVATPLPTVEYVPPTPIGTGPSAPAGPGDGAGENPDNQLV
jgi:hypothetical protein